MKRENKLFLVWAAGAAMLLVLVAVACQPSGAVDGTPLPPSATVSAPLPPETTASSTPLPPSATASMVQETGMPDAPSTVAPAATLTGEPDASGREMRLTPTPLPSLERVPVSEPTLVTGEVPTDLLDAILQDAEAWTGIAAGELDIIRAEAVIWNDGSLGCPQPGVMYTQALVDGYWVVLEYGDQTFDYRASDRGYFFLCEQSSLLKTIPPAGGASSTPQQ